LTGDSAPGVKSEMTRMPNFFIIGAPKCGTTSLAAWLAGNPAIFVSPIKEPYYFSVDLRYRFIGEWDDYLRLFRDAGDEAVAVGEATTAYLFSRDAVPLIENKFSSAKYIVMVRNPVDMAYSLHEQQLFSDRETVRDFGEAWNLSSERRHGREVPAHCVEPLLLDYQSFCRLGEQVERLFCVVPRERILLLVLDDMRLNPREEYLKTLDFLGAPDDGRMDFPVHNRAKRWRSRQVGRMIRAAAQLVARAKHTTGMLPRRSLGLIDFLRSQVTDQQRRPAMPKELRAELERFFSPDIAELERLLGRDFPGWRETYE